MPDLTNITDFDPASGLTTTTLVASHDRGTMDWAERQVGGLENIPMTPGGTPPPQPDPAPTLTSLTPNTSVVGVPIVVTVAGTGFKTGAVVKADGADLPTVFVSATELTVSGTPIVDGTSDITVTNPDGQVSGAVVYTVTAV